jgi:hypothetical protein
MTGSYSKVSNAVVTWRFDPSFEASSCLYLYRVPSSVKTSIEGRENPLGGLSFAKTLRGHRSRLCNNVTELPTHY